MQHLGIRAVVYSIYTARKSCKPRHMLLSSSSPSGSLVSTTDTQRSEFIDIVSTGVNDNRDDTAGDDDRMNTEWRRVSDETQTQAYTLSRRVVQYTRRYRYRIEPILCVVVATSSIVSYLNNHYYSNHLQTVYKRTDVKIVGDRIVQFSSCLILPTSKCTVGYSCLPFTVDILHTSPSTYW